MKDVREINFRDLLKYNLKKWKIILTVCIVFSVFLTLYAIFFVDGEKVSAYEIDEKNIEDLIENTKNFKDLEDYVEKSSLMKLDPFDFYIGAIQISVISSNIQNDYQGTEVMSYFYNYSNIDLFIDLEKEFSLDSAENLKELVTAETSGNTITLMVKGQSVLACEKLINAIESDLQNNIKDIPESFSECNVIITKNEIIPSVDSKLNTYQKDIRQSSIDAEKALKTQTNFLNTAEKEIYNENVEEKYKLDVDMTENKVKSKIVYSIFGALFGILVSGFFISLWYCISGKILGEKDIELRFGIKNLLYINVDKKMQDQINYLFLVIKKKLEKDGISSVWFVSTVFGEINSEVLETIKSKMSELSIEVNYLISNNTEKEIEMLEKAKNIIFIEKIGISRYKSIENYIKRFKQNEINILGNILIN